MINRGLQGISLVFLKDFVEASNNDDNCIMQVLIYICLVVLCKNHLLSLLVRCTTSTTCLEGRSIIMVIAQVADFA